MIDLDQALQEKLAALVPLGRSGLLPALQLVQKHHGYLPEASVVEIGRFLGVPLADIHGVIEFYSMFYTKPVGNTMLRVCTDVACSLRGGEELLKAVCHQHAVHPGETSSNGDITIERSTCLGLCDHAPAVLRNELAVGSASIKSLVAPEQEWNQAPQTVIYGEPRLLSANCGKGRATTLDEYVQGGGYEGLVKALRLEPEQIIHEIKTAGLVGRGGAAFPTSVKWGGAARAVDEPKYVVCNADESEPGTFKDRVLLEEDPHRVIEGLIIAGYAIGAHTGYIYVRGEYPAARRVLEMAISEARQAGYIGNRVLETAFPFDIELRSGAGAYICGEETALFESIEGKRGYPRLKPPFPTTHGLFGKPTAINNVETLANVPLIIARGAAVYRHYGTQNSPGTKLLCLSGDVEHPGLYEVPFGITLRHLVEDLAGGAPDGQKLQAILIGGAAGSFVGPGQLDIEISIEGLQAGGLMLGSGVVMAFDERRDLRQILANIARFFAHESCGKCYPCQIGTRRQLEILNRLAGGSALDGDFERLSDVGWTMADASICGLGQTAASATLSAMRLWPEMFPRSGS